MPPSKAILLSAGRGRRMLPLTARTPKCLLPVRGSQTLVDLQLETLESCGVSEAVVVVGFGADAVAASLARRRGGGLVARTLRNPSFDDADNLVSCWRARAELDGDIVLANGDTLFERDVLERLLSAPPAPVTGAVDRKPSYDPDDMKVCVDGAGRLLAVGKEIDPASASAEAIGLIRLQGSGAPRLRGALGVAMRREDAKRAYYLAAVQHLAATTHVATLRIDGLWWAELDTAQDLAGVRVALAGARRPRPRRMAASGAGRAARAIPAGGGS